MYDREGESTLPVRCKFVRYEKKGYCGIFIDDSGHEFSSWIDDNGGVLAGEDCFLIQSTIATKVGRKMSFRVRTKLVKIDKMEGNTI